jgi:hypothetical protein
MPPARRQRVLISSAPPLRSWLGAAAGKFMADGAAEHNEKKDPGSDAGVLSYASTTENLADKADRLQPVENLIGPEPLESVQRLVEH